MRIEYPIAFSFGRLTCVTAGLSQAASGFFSSGAFIGDYSGIAANDQAIYAAWTDGRDSNIVNTGVGETDVFTAVQILGA